MTSIPAGATAAYSDAVECPGCKAPLDLSTAPRYIATTLGLAAGAAVAWLTRNSTASLGWTVPLVAGFLAYGVVAAFVTLLLGDLRLRAAEPAAAPAAAGSAHSRGPAHH
jgi:hypothetical protein